MKEKKRILFKGFFFISILSFAFTLLPYKFYSNYTLEEIVKVVERYSNYKFKTKPIVKFLNEKEFENKIEKILKRDYPSDKILKECIFLNAFKLIDKDINLIELKRKIYFKNVAGFYDEGGKSNEIYIKGEKKKSFGKMEAMLLFHELWHIIQKNRVDFEKLLPDTIEYDDRRLAILSMLEGDAIRFMEKASNIKLAIDNPDISIEEALSLSGDKFLLNAPRIVREELIFPYIYGTRFIKFFEKPEEKAQIYKNPPKSSYEIIFPSSYPYKRETLVSKQTGFFSGKVGIFFMNIIINKKISNYSYLKGWEDDNYTIYYNRNTKRYSLLWEIRFKKWGVRTFLNHLRKKFPEAKISLIENKIIKFQKEGYYGCNYCHSD